MTRFAVRDTRKVPENEAAVRRSGTPEGVRDRLTFSYAGVSEDGFEPSLRTEPPGAVRMTVQDVSEGPLEMPGMEIEPCKSRQPT